MIRIFLLVFLAVSLHAQIINGVAILVKDEPITMMDVAKEMEKHGNDKNKAADALIRQKLEELEIKERKISVTKKEVHDDVVKIAAKNGMKANEFYESIYSMQKITQSEFKEQIKKKILNQKLYAAIAFSHIDEPSKTDIEEFYNLHKAEYEHAGKYDVIVYVSGSKESLESVRNNPMMVAADVSSQPQTLEYGKINAQLARLMEVTPLKTFTPVVTVQDRYMMFLVQKKYDLVKQPLKTVTAQISNQIMGEKRQQVLNDYFTRLRMNADIKIIRLP